MGHNDAQSRWATTVPLTLLALAWFSPVSGQTVRQTSPARRANRPAQQTAPTALAFKDVTVIDVATGQPIPNQTVIVTGNRIQAVGPAASTVVPRNAQVVDARGKYLVPGFWDMHSHIDDNAGIAYPMYIANGVTGVREMAQRGEFPDSFRVWQREVMTGARIGPRVIGPSADLSRFQVGTPEQAARIIDSLKTAGDAFVKFHGTQGENNLFFAFAHEARRVGLPMVGHMPPAVVPNVQAVDSGLADVQHINIDYDCVVRPEKPAISADSLEKQCATITQAYLRNGTWLTPTITIDYYRYFHGSEYGTPQVFADYQQYLQRLYRLGIRNFLTGTDCVIDEGLRETAASSMCGFSLLQEMMLLNEAGLPTADVLRAATLGPATFLHGTDSLGTVETGKLADLVLLDADPLADIHNVAKIRAVVANGRYFDRPALDAMDPDATAMAKDFLAEWTGSKRVAR